MEALLHYRSGQRDRYTFSIETIGLERFHVAGGSVFQGDPARGVFRAAKKKGAQDFPLTLRRLLANRLSTLFDTMWYRAQPCTFKDIMVEMRGIEPVSITN